MAFLTLNGWPVLVDTCEQTLAQVRDDARAFDGTWRLNKLGTKRTWQVKTVLMPFASHEALRCIVTQRGEYIPADTDLFTARGTPATGYARLFSGQGYDGTPILGQSKFGQGALCVASGPGTAQQNLLSAAQAMFMPYSSAAVPAVGGATVSQGSKGPLVGRSDVGSIAIVPQQAVGSGVQVTCSVAQGGAYVASALVLGPVGHNYRLTLNDGATTIPGPVVALQPNAWQVLTVATPAAASTSITVQLVTAAAPPASLPCTAGALQLEPGPDATAWMTPGNTYPPGQLSYAVSVRAAYQPTGLTLSAWAQTGAVTGAPKVILAATGLPGTAQLYLNGTGQLCAEMPGASTPSLVSPQPLPPGLHHVGCALDAPGCALYQDGAPVALGPGVAMSGLAGFTVGGQVGGGATYNAALDEVMVLPAAMQADWWAAQALATSAAGGMPRLVLAGDVVGGTATPCNASQYKVDFKGYDDGTGVWQDAGGVASFTLTEA